MITRTREATGQGLSEPIRNNFYYGKLLDVAHLQMEQDYGKRKRWLLNRLSLGRGVLCGLQVVADGGKLCVAPGVAIDDDGREIVVSQGICIDPYAPGAPCETEWPARDEEPPRGPATLWLCYRECLTDFAPATQSCHGQDGCEAGTIVESFSFRISPGVEPRPGGTDPCAVLAPAGPGRAVSAGNTVGNTAALMTSSMRTALSARTEGSAADPYALLCRALSGDCEISEGDGCISIATFEYLGDGEIGAVDDCSVRPRVYSNTVLLDLILCLAIRVEECCSPQTPPVVDTLRIDAVEMVKGTPGDEQLVDPKKPIRTKITSEPMGIRVRFNRAIKTDSVTTAEEQLESAAAKASLLVEREKETGDARVVAGRIEVEAADTVVFRNADGTFKPGAYRISLFGDEDPGGTRPAITGADGTRLDGEPTALPSGDGQEGGVFTFRILVTDN